MRSQRLTLTQFDYKKKDGVYKNLVKFIKKNILVIIISFSFIFIIDRCSVKNILWSLTTLYFILGWSYFTHRVLHHPIGKKILWNYHYKHHDHDISNTLIWRLVEYFYMDFIVGGGAMLIIINMIIEKIGGPKCFNYYIILYWSLVYTSHHAFNWHSTNSLNPHFFHHENLSTNFGPDFMDIFFQTKMDEDIIEDMNSLVYNSCVVMAFFCLL